MFWLVSKIILASNTKKKKKLKKDTQLVLRMDSDMRNQFVDICKELDTTAAREVRRFIKRFIRRYENGEYDD